MRPARSAAAVVAAAAAAAVLTAACSGAGTAGSAGSAGAGSTSSTSALAAATTTEAPTFTGTGSERFCDDDRAARQSLQRLGEAGPSIDSLRDRYLATAASLTALSEVAPAEIAGDLKVLARAYDALTSAMQKAGWDASRLTAEIGDKLGTPEVRVASERLRAYERSVCGIN